MMKKMQLDTVTVDSFGRITKLNFDETGIIANKGSFD
jgi:hypothetical protein